MQIKGSVKRENIIVAGLMLFIILGSISYFSEKWVILEWEQLRVNFYLFFLAFAVLGIQYLLTIFNWLGTYSSFHRTFSFREGFRIYTISNLGKYMPGKIWMFLGRGYFSKKEGGSFYAGTLSVFIEQFLKGTSGLVLGLLYSSYLIFQFKNIFIILFLLLAVSPFLFHPKIFDTLIKFLYKKATGQVLKELKINRRRIIYMFFLYIISWHIFGAVIALLYYWITGSVSLSLYLVFTGVFALSWLIGMFAVITPAGFGIREGVFVVFLSPVIPESIGIILVLILRLQIILIDLLFALAGTVLGADLRRKCSYPG